MSIDMSDSRVLIVGAGSAGATAALLLAEHGIDTLVIERRVAPPTHPAAHVLSTRTLEVFRELGPRTRCAPPQFAALRTA